MASSSPQGLAMVVHISIDEGHAAKLEWVLCDLGGQSEGTLRSTPSDKQKYVENVVRTYSCSSNS